MAAHKPNEPKQIQPTEPPDPATSYERADPKKEAGMGRLNNDPGTPTDDPDRAEDAVKNVQEPKGIAAEETTDVHEQPRDLTGEHPATLPPQPDHSMHEEEPLGEEQGPQDIHNPRFQRHPRTPGTNQGGTP
jgi:hypothetical protein